MADNENDIPSLKEILGSDPVGTLKSFGYTVVLIVVVIFMGWVFVNLGDFDRIFIAQSAYNFTGAFSNLVAPLIALLAATLTFAAFWVQYQANEIQKDYIKKQRFEDTFFRLLDNHQRIVEAMDLMAYPNESEISYYRSQGQVPPAPTVIASNRDCFKTIYSDFKKRCGDHKDLEYAIIQYGYTQNLYKSDLHHYFRFIYRVLKFVKESDLTFAEQYAYTSIFRAVFNPYELIMLFYNGLHPLGEKLKPLMEEFIFLKNFDETLLIDDSHERGYSKALG